MAFDWSSQRILIADRDDQFRFFVRGLFKHHRVRDVLSVTHACDLPRILAHHEIQVAFVELPHDDAGVIRTLQWLRGNKESPAPQLPVILLVKALDKAQLARVCAFGIHGILQKPVSGEKLMNAVIGVVTNPKMFKSAGEPVNLAKNKAIQPSINPPVGPQPSKKRVTVGGGSRGGVAGDGGSEDVVAGSSLGLFADGELTARKKAAGGDIEVAVASEEKPASRAWPDEPLDAKPKSRVKKTTENAAKKEARVEPEIGEPVFAEVAQSSKRKKKEAETGPSVEEILAAHALWALAGGREGQRANLTGRDLCGLTLVEAVLTSAVLRKADLSGCDLSGAELHGADLREADLTASKFVGANMAVARLRHAKLRGCLFSQASLKGADLAGADLTAAKMDDADLSAAILLGARLDDADLSRVSGLTQGQLDGVEGNARTRLPPGLSLPLPNEVD